MDLISCERESEPRRGANRVQSTERSDEVAGADPGVSESARHRLAWLGLALALYTLALAVPFREVFRAGLTQAVPMNQTSAVADVPARDAMELVLGNDQHFVTWLLARNAWAMLARPGALFDAGICHPTPDVLALGEPMLTLGALGVVPYWITRDPILTFNLVQLGLVLISALVMFWVVREWTGVPAAGLLAGLLYAYHPAKMYDITHPYLADNVWTVLALLFATRLFEGGRVRDGVGLGLAIAAQIGGSIYPMLAATLVGSAFLVWLIARYRFSRLAPWPLVCAALIVVPTAYFVYAPYLEAASLGQISPRNLRKFVHVWNFAPGAYYFPGWPMLVLALAALVLPVRDAWNAREWQRVISTPALCLLVGALLSYFAAASGARPLQPSAFHAWLAGFIPGLDAVRAPERIVGGVHVALSLLAGLGTAGLLRLLHGTARTVGASVAVAFVVFSLLMPGLSGLRGPIVFDGYVIRPADERLAFYETLAARGLAGPVLEIPAGAALFSRTKLIAQAWHHRPTSACGGQSFAPPEVQVVQRVVARLPATDALEQAHALGFETLIIHHGDARLTPQLSLLRTRLLGIARTLEGAGRRVHADDYSEAFRLGPLVEGKAESVGEAASVHAP